MLVCAFGACEGDPEPPEQKCICKPTMTIEMPQQQQEKEERTPTCNNATFDWMMQTLLTEVSAQKEHIINQNDQITDLQKKLEQRLNDIANSEEDKNILIDQKNLLSSQNQDLEIQIKELTDALETQKRHHLDEVTELKAQNSQYTSKIEELNENLKKYKSSQGSASQPKDCRDIQKKGSRYSGIYTVYPKGIKEGLQVFCDQNTDHGGWMLIQRRQDGTQKFDKTWNEYKEGFGQVAREFWIGNDNLHKITTTTEYELRIELLAFDGEFRSATYDFFSVDSEDNNYKLTLGDYSGDSGDALINHNNRPFSTFDRDNDESKSGNCSKLYGFGGWWFAHCYDSNLNGQYYQDGQISKQGVNWFKWRKFESLRHVEMKIRPV